MEHARKGSPPAVRVDAAGVPAGRASRRGFLRGALQLAVLTLSGIRPLAARAAEHTRAQAVAWARRIHEGTANTLRGALGERVRALGWQRRPRKLYPERPRRRVPSAPVEAERSLAETIAALESRASGTGTARPLEWPQLARLLHLANGVTGRAGGARGRTLRAAPSAGALYAGEVYVLAERVRGLEAGVYYYSPLGRELILLHERPVFEELGRALELPSGLAGAAAAVVLTNVFARYRWRYANRGYRYALIDSGHIGENLRLAAASTGFAAPRVDRFHDDRLNALLGVDGVGEAACALHLVGPRGGPRAGASKPGPARPRLVEADALGLGSGRGDDLPERFHAATRLLWPAPGVVPDPGQRGPGEGHDRALAGRAAVADRLVLPPGKSGKPGRAAPTTGELIEQRRSPPGFEPRPIALDALATVLAAAGRAANPIAGALEIQLVVHRVAGLAPGLYRHDAGSRALVTRRRGASSDEFVSLCLRQRMAGDAAVAVLVVGRPGEAAGRHGGRAYRDQLLEAGAIAERVYLAAGSAGLAARNLAAFLDEPLARFLDLDEARREAVLHLTVVGYPQTRS